MRNWTLGFALAFLVSLICPAETEAQVQITPRGGAYGSPSEFGIVESEWGSWRIGERKPIWAFGLTIGLGLSDRFDLRLTGLMGARSEIRTRNVQGGKGPDVTTAVQALSAELSFDLFEGPHSLCLYILVGGGVLRNDFQYVEGFQVGYAFSETPRSSVVLGAGVERDFGKFTIDFEAADHLSGSSVSDGGIQHNIFFSLGIGRAFSWL